MKRDFFYGISYLKSAIDLKQEQIFVSYVRWTYKYLISLINDVLDMSRIEAGKMKMNKDRIDLEEIVNHVMQMESQPALDASIKFTYEEKDKFSTDYIGDSVRLRQCLMNLVSNAIKFTPSGGTVVLSAGRTPLDNQTDQIRLAVEDTGVGMSEEYIQHIFTPFEQEKNSMTNSAHTGSGLGLSIVYNLVRLMGGTVTVASKKDVGSRFEIVLPLQRVKKEEKSQKEQEDEISETVLKSALSGKHILLVEDHPINRQIITKLLEKMELIVDAAENDIPSYKAIATDKTVITFGKFYTFDHTELESSLEEKFPEVDFVFEECSAGDKQLSYIKVLADNGALPDMFLTSQTIPENDFLYDLGGESYAGRYNLSFLQAITVEDHLYQIPVSNTTFGIAYNKDLFKQNGRNVPSTLDELYTLCDTIAATGIRSLVTCMKYYTTVESSGADILPPSSEVLTNLYDKGIVTADDFTSSATTNRQDLYDGKSAMMPCNLDIIELVESEKPDAEIGFIGFPTTEADQRIMQVVPGINISVNKTSMEDKTKKDIINSTIDYIKDGNIFFAKYFGSDALLPTVQRYMTGEISFEEMTAVIDEAVKNSDPFEGLSEAPIGTASETFTVLDTSNYNADVLRDATGAEIALVPNKSFYCGNIAQIFKGDIVLPNRFTQKGIDGDARLTTYEITGAKLKELLEHPIIAGNEVNILYTVSGLKVTYAPWAEADKNVLSVALADGTEIDDSKTYTVAAWPKAIDETYISGIAQTFEDAGKNQDLMAAAIQKAGTIASAKDGRITLEWDTD